MNLLGYNLHILNLNKINFKSKTIINTINPHSYAVAKYDNEFKSSLTNSNYLMPDGVGFVLAAFILKQKIIKRITGYDIHKYFLNLANKKSLKVFYFGSSIDTLENIKEKNTKRFPKLDAMYYSPPFKKVFLESDNMIFKKIINEFSPDILFVGMTAPKQEKWVYENYKSINCKVFISIGAVFDFYSNKIKRPHIFFQKLGLEWLIRFINEPKRLFRRNFISLPIFIKDLFLEFIKFK